MSRSIKKLEEELASRCLFERRIVKLSATLRP
ncbi:hypothetical protein [Bacillus sp. B19-2]|nr:hypothetical protein [Bacillus sp. B19-2]MCJ2147518.1 hypothetical protein [Bacillus sp. B19-2]